MKSNKMNFRQNYKFVSSAIANDQTFIDYMNRFEKIALSIFEWVNLPKSMDSRYLEKCLYYFGQASLLYDPLYGFINTKCTTANKVNIYGLPTDLRCYSFEYNTTRKLYTGLKGNDSKEKDCILVMNNWTKTPTVGSMRLFAQRMYEAERSSDVNIRNQKFPMLLVTTENKRLSFENIYSQIDGNKPAIMVNQENFDPNSIKAVSTEAPFVADKLQEYKKTIWNEALTFLRNQQYFNRKERKTCNR